MQQTHARMSQPAHEGRPAPRLAVIVLTVVTIAATACRDVATAPTMPRTLALSVSGDGAWLVNSLAEPGDGICSNNECTLREAIAAAQSGDRITFKSNLSGTIALVLGQLKVEKSVTIEGPGAGVLAIDGRNSSAVFVIGPTSGPPAIVTISGLTITGGREFFGGGGIVVNYESRLALIGSIVTASSAPRGGGIYNYGRLTLVSSTVSGNLAGIGGGGIFNNGVLTLNRSTVSGNRSLDVGGGIYTSCAVIGCGDGLTIRSSTVTANDAVTAGGGVHVEDTGVMVNSILAGNRVNGDAAALTADCSEFGGLKSLGHTLKSSTGCGGLHGSPTDVVVPTSQVFTAVLELALADNGGRVTTHALIERGFAIDAGYCPGETVDGRGFPRPYDDARMPNAVDGCDIGAFEWQPADTKTKGPKP
jgi:CSLREA domain-containing protein